MAVGMSYWIEDMSHEEGNKSALDIKKKVYRKYKLFIPYCLFVRRRSSLHVTICSSVVQILLLQKLPLNLQKSSINLPIELLLYLF